MSLKIKAYAKVNLWLDITGRLENGYHTLNTVMRRIDLYDNISLEEGGEGIEITCDNPSVPCNEKNIAYRAAEAFYKETGLKPSLKLHIEKRIPLEGGLGGSSADGAAILTALNSLHGSPVPEKRLLEIGKALGADVPFCMTGGTAVCRGIGEIMTPVEAGELYLLIIKPDFSCNTGEGFRAYDNAPVEEKGGFDDFCNSLNSRCSLWSGNMYNIFEELYNDSRIEKIKRRLIESGAEGALMSGSGSCVFGVFDTAEKAEKASGLLDYPCQFVVKAL